MTGESKVKNAKVRTALTYLKNKDLIVNNGSDAKSIWVKK